MTLQQINYALTVAECGSMNKAAEKLFIVQPTLTNAIKELEQEIGISIFLRTHKGILPTPEGNEFLCSVRQLYSQYENILNKYVDRGDYRRKFGVSTQHYSFAVKAFVEMAKHYDMNRFDFAIRETQTRAVIKDVADLRSEIGVLYMSNSNKKAIGKLLKENELVFHPLIKSRAYVYLWRHHPLALRKSLTIGELEPYPCLSFEQGDESGYYFAEEILGENVYPRTIKACDRATILNLMSGLGGYMLCSGIISDGLNGDDYIVIPFREDEDNPNSIMQIGYITKKGSLLSMMGEQYIEELKKCLEVIGDRDVEL